jgi:hypothetical protein
MIQVTESSKLIIFFPIVLYCYLVLARKIVVETGHRKYFSAFAKFTISLSKFTVHFIQLVDLLVFKSYFLEPNVGGSGIEITSWLDIDLI